MKKGEDYISRIERKIKEHPGKKEIIIPKEKIPPKTFPEKVLEKIQKHSKK